MTFILLRKRRHACTFRLVWGIGFYRCHLLVWDVVLFSWNGACGACQHMAAAFSPSALQLPVPHQHTTHTHTHSSMVEVIHQILYVPLLPSQRSPGSQSPHLSSSHLPKHFSGACSSTFRLFKQSSGTNFVCVAASTRFGAEKVEWRRPRVVCNTLGCE